MPSASSRPRRMRWVSRLQSTESATADNKKPRNAGLFYQYKRQIRIEDALDAKDPFCGLKEVKNRA